MTAATTDKLAPQLRIIYQLTNTEIQVAQTRQAQARDEDVRKELAANAEKARERAGVIADALTNLGRAPDVITPALGRAAALAKTVVEQSQPLAGALFGDLALEHQLLDRANYLEALADTSGNTDVRNLARRLQTAHQETLNWITSILVEEASDEPTKIRPTPVQAAVGRLATVINAPTRWTVERINGTVGAVTRSRSRVRTLVGSAADSVTAAQITDRDGPGGLTEDELPVKNYSDLTVSEISSAIGKLKDADALTALLRFEQSHKDRAGAAKAIEARLSAMGQRNAGRKAVQHG